MRSRLLKVFTAAALIAGCRPAGGGSPAAPAPEAAAIPGTPAAPAPSEPAGAAPRLLDLSGRYTNAVELEGNLGLGSATFPFLPDRGGTMLLIGLEYDYGTCTKATLDARVFLQSFGKDGALARVYELDVMRPLRVARKESYQLVIQLKAQEACTGASARVALRYFAPRPLDPRGSGDGGDGGTDGDTDGGGADGGGPDGGDGTADGGDRPDPCPPLRDRAGELPSGLKGGFVLHGRRSIQDGCEALLTWKMADNMKSLDPPACNLPTAKFEARSEAPSLLKAFDSRPDFDFNLFWLRIPDPVKAAAVLRDLEEGKTVDLVAGPNDCPGLPVTTSTVVMDDDLDLMLFAGDPRDACLGPKAPAEMMDLNPAAGDTFQISYQYGANDPASYFWKARFALPASQATGSLVHGTRARLYNRRVRAFVTDWVALTGEPNALTLEVKDPAALRRILPYQGDLEILLAPADSADSCPVAYAVPYHRLFLDSSLNSRFSDGTHAGRSRHLLKESDLPL